MKKKMTPREMLVVGGILVTILGAAVGTWLGLGSLGEKQAEFQVLVDRLANPALAGLLAKPGGAGQAVREAGEIQKLAQSLQETEGSSALRWAEGTREAQGEGKEWAKDPGRWKDELIAAQSDLQKKAPSQQVKLAPDFYLGLEAYRQKSPATEEVPRLAVELSVARRLVERLFEARKIREQYVTACELKSLTGPSSSTVEGSKTGAAPAAPAPKRPGSALERKNFRVELECSPEVLYEYVRLLSQDPWLLILQDLSVQSRKEDFPRRSEIAKKFSGPEAAAKPQETASKKKLLEILAGDEKLFVSMEIAFVPWQQPDDGKTGANPGKP